MSVQERFLSIEGRLRRSEYFIRMMLLGVPSYVLEFVTRGSDDPIVLIAAGFLMIILGILSLIQVAKRLHDMNMSGWFALVFIIPFINIVFGLFALFVDGTVGPNQYGEDPKGRMNPTHQFEEEE